MGKGVKAVTTANFCVCCVRGEGGVADPPLRPLLLLAHFGIVC